MKPILHLELSRVQRYESSISKQFDECWFASSVDKEAIKGLPSNVRIVPQGADLNYFKPNPSREQTSDIMFVSYMNSDAVGTVLYFYEEIFPIIRKEMPPAKFYIIGANPPKKILALGKDPNIVITGFVDDLRPYYNNAAVAIAPFRFASGTQTKVLEAMAMGVSVVSTSAVSEGIHAVHGENIFVADEPAQFAHWVLELLKNPQLRQEVGTNAQKFVEQRFTWNVVLDRVAEIERGLATRSMPSCPPQEVEYAGRN